MIAARPARPGCTGLSPSLVVVPASFWWMIALVRPVKDEAEQKQRDKGRYSVFLKQGSLFVAFVRVILFPVEKERAQGLVRAVSCVLSFEA